MNTGKANKRKRDESRNDTPRKKSTSNVPGTPVSGPAPKPDDLVKLLLQSSKTKDYRSMREAFINCGDKIIKTTVKKLPTEAVFPLCKELIKSLQGKKPKMPTALDWLWRVVVTHADYLSSDKKISEAFVPVLPMLEGYEPSGKKLKKGPRKEKVSKVASEGPDECVICQDAYVNKTFADPCMHAFCYECIKKWLTKKNACPLCARPSTKLMFDVQSDSQYKIEHVKSTTFSLLFSSDDSAPEDYDDDDDDYDYDYDSDGSAMAIPRDAAEGYQLTVGRINSLEFIIGQNVDLDLDPSSSDSGEELYNSEGADSGSDDELSLDSLSSSSSYHSDDSAGTGSCGQGLIGLLQERVSDDSSSSTATDSDESYHPDQSSLNSSDSDESDSSDSNDCNNTHQENENSNELSDCSNFSSNYNELSDCDSLSNNDDDYDSDLS